jgi:hypothetical protein
MRASDLIGARDCFQHAGGPPAAFGYALSTLLSLGGDPQMQALLKKLGQPAWDPTTQLFGPTGWLLRTMRDWSTRVTVAATGQAGFDRVKLGRRSGMLHFLLRSGTTPGQRLSVHVPDGAGTTTYTVSDPTQPPPVGSPEVRVEADFPDRFSAATSGTITVATGNGADVTLTLDVVIDRDTHVTGTATAAPAGCNVLADEVPFQNLRRGVAVSDMLDEIIQRADPGIVVSDVTDALGSLAPQLSRASACFAAAADGHNGFSVPASFYGGTQDLVFSAADSRALGALTGAVSAAITFVRAYDWGIAAARVLKNGAVDAGLATAELNRHFLSLTNAAALVDARDQFAKVASIVLAGIDGLANAAPPPAGAVFDYSSITAAQRDFARGWVLAAARSLVGPAALPGAQPPQSVDASVLFVKRPIDAKAIDIAPFDYDGSIRVVESFWRIALRGIAMPDFIAAPEDHAAPRFSVPTFRHAGDVTVSPGARAQAELLTDGQFLGCR